MNIPVLFYSSFLLLLCPEAPQEITHPSTRVHRAVASAVDAGAGM